WTYWFSLTRPGAEPGFHEVSGYGLRDFFSFSITDQYAASQALRLAAQKSIWPRRAMRPRCPDLSVPCKSVLSVLVCRLFHRGGPSCARDSTIFERGPVQGRYRRWRAEP